MAQIPAKHFHFVTITRNNDCYKITAPWSDRSVYSLYKQKGPDDYKLLSTSNNPLKLEQKIDSGAYDNS